MALPESPCQGPDAPSVRSGQGRGKKGGLQWHAGDEYQKLPFFREGSIAWMNGLTRMKGWTRMNGLTRVNGLSRRNGLSCLHR